MARLFFAASGTPFTTRSSSGSSATAGPKASVEEAVLRLPESKGGLQVDALGGCAHPHVKGSLGVGDRRVGDGG